MVGCSTVFVRSIKIRSLIVGFDERATYVWDLENCTLLYKVAEWTFPGFSIMIFEPFLHLVRVSPAKSRSSSILHRPWCTLQKYLICNIPEAFNGPVLIRPRGSILCAVDLIHRGSHPGPFNSISPWFDRLATFYSSSPSDFDFGPILPVFLSMSGIYGPALMDSRVHNSSYKLKVPVLIRISNYL